MMLLKSKKDDVFYKAQVIYTCARLPQSLTIIELKNE
jgi:hypothetical protein